MSYTPRFDQFYDDVVAPKLHEQFGYSSKMEIPRLVNICINQGVGQATQDKKLVDVYHAEMTTITGQKAVSTIAKTSISNIK
jgi:large subunit ribosomal protein L5